MEHVKSKVIYEYKGKIYHKVESVQKVHANEIGKVVDRAENFLGDASVVFTHRHRLAMFDWLKENRAEIVELLETTIDDEKGNPVRLMDVEFDS
ncbi:hypothetical protein GR28A_00059 [Vibrio phage vB_VcorM_GR28A]|nr:hypothetical protein GR28A_00059 [Vibrio phage vB_VcorM_GR28A]